MRVRYFCHYGSRSGYGRAARDYLAALHQTGACELEIACLPEHGAIGLVSPETRYGDLDPLAVRCDAIVGPADVEVFHATPRTLSQLAQLGHRPWPAPYDGPTLAITTWETSRLPTEYAAALARYDQVIVPSGFCADRLLEAWVELDLPVAPTVIPHCFDEAWWPEPTARTREPGAPYRFLSVGAWGERKNMLGVLRAYLSTFTSDDHVELMLLCFGADYDEIRSLVARSGLAADQVPAVHVPSAIYLTDGQLVELHQAADCYVSATRCEGWGLGMFEAMILGKPVIAPLYGGQSDFLLSWPRALELDGVHRVPHQLTPCFGTEERDRAREGQGGDRLAIARVSMPPGVTCRQWWAEPDLVAMAGHMRTLSLGGDDLDADVAIARRRHLEERFGYLAVARQLERLLKGHLE